jgi:DNA-binding LacI/PurR family transcriptional regulator
MKYLEIYNKIKEDIVSGKYPENTRLPFTKELIKKYGVSSRTVQHAMKILQLDGLVKGVPSKGTFVRKRKDSHLYSASRKELRVVVLTPQSITGAMVASYFNNIFWGVEKTLERIGGRVHLISIRNRQVQEIIREILFLEINNIITSEIEDKTFLREIERLGLPVVHLEIPEIMSHKPVIAANNVQGGSLALKKLVDLGHKKILYLGTYIPSIKKNDAMSDRRWQGISELARKKNLKNVNQEIISLDSRTRARSVRKVLERHNDFSGIISTVGFQLIKSVLEERPQADTRNIDLVAFDMTEKPALIHRKPVYFCKWDGKQMGERAMKILLGNNARLPRVQLLPMFLERNL